MDMTLSARLSRYENDTLVYNYIGSASKETEYWTCLNIDDIFNPEYKSSNWILPNDIDYIFKMDEDFNIELCIEDTLQQVFAIHIMVSKRNDKIIYQIKSESVKPDINFIIHELYLERYIMNSNNLSSEINNELIHILIDQVNTPVKS